MIAHGQASRAIRKDSLAHEPIEIGTERGATVSSQGVAPFIYFRF